MKIQFYRTLLGMWRWRVRAGNNRIIGSSSEGYFNRIDCVKNAAQLGKALTENTL